MKPADIIKSQPGNGGFVHFANVKLVRTSAGIAPFGSVMTDFQREAVAALAPSLEALACGEIAALRRFMFIWSKGCGKGLILCIAILYLAAFARVPLFIQVGAADRDQGAEQIKQARELLAIEPVLSDRIEVFAWKISCEATGFVGEIVAADIASSHGSRPDLLLIDEAHAITQWELVLNWLANAAKVAHNVTVILSNAGFVGSDFHKLYLDSLESPRWFTHEVQRPADWINSDDYRGFPTEFTNRLFYGKWSHGTGTALSVQDVEACVTARGPHPCRLNYAYLAAADLATKRDRAAVVVLGVDAATWTDAAAENQVPRIHLAACVAWNPADYPDGRIPLEDVKKEILQLHQKFNLAGIIFDMWQAQLMTEQLLAAGLHCHPLSFSPKNLDQMARDLLETFQNRWIKLYRDEALLADLFRLNVIERPQGFRLDAKRDKAGHADRATALAMALPSALEWSREFAVLHAEGELPDFPFSQTA